MEKNRYFLADCEDKKRKSEQFSCHFDTILVDNSYILGLQLLDNQWAFRDFRSNARSPCGLHYNSQREKSGSERNCINMQFNISAHFSSVFNIYTHFKKKHFTPYQLPSQDGRNLRHVLLWTH